MDAPRPRDALPGVEAAQVPAPLRARAEAGARWVQEQAEAGRTVTVVHHIDADGLSAGAIALEALARAGVPHSSVAAKSLDDVHVARIRAGPDGQGPPEALWFCDFGSTAYMHFDVPRLVCDHHELVRDGGEEAFPHVNPLLDGLAGDSVSGAGLAYLVAEALDPRYRDLVPIALVGATGDLQDRHGGFHGTNLCLLEQGLSDGVLEARRDVCWFGPETRPLWKYLCYAESPPLDGLTGKASAVHELLANLQVSERGPKGDRAWAHLHDDERRRLLDCLLLRVPDAQQEAVMRTVVRIAGEQVGSPVRELQEFATLLNSTARYGQPQLGLAVARGDRTHAYRLALDSRDHHRQNLAQSVSRLRPRLHVRNAIQFLHAEDQVLDTVLGIVCGMLLNGADAHPDMPIVGLAWTDDGQTKASARAPRRLEGAIDLATAMREAAAAVGGVGGGHKGAAGATVPRMQEHAFVTHLETAIAVQLGRHMPAAPGTPVVAQAVAPVAATAWRPKGRGQTRLT